MSESSFSELTVKHPKTILLATTTAILETCVQHIKDADYRQISVAVAPFIALGITILLKTAHKRYKCNAMKKLLKEWIASLNDEIDNPRTTAGRRREAQKEVAKYREELKDVEKDFIGFVFD